MNEFYREYLDADVDRRGTNCEKWDRCGEHFGRADVIPMWVADMDFRTVPAISEALVKRAQHAIYGYTENAKEEKAAECGWLQRRYGLHVEPEWILYSPGVVDSLFFCVRSMTEEGDKILVQPPVYGPFYRAVQSFGRELVENNLIHSENGWEMDFELLEKQLAEDVKMMILCSPHNPVGRVWTAAELKKVVDLANKYDVIIVSDEIHADFNLGSTPHTRILAVDGADKCVMLTSATKSFNLAGLRQSSAIVKNAQLREKLAAEIERAHAGTPNIFGAIAQTVAYSEGDEWMDAVVEYIRENRDFAVNFIRERIPQIKCEAQEGSYLMWLDCREVGLSHDAFFRRVIDEAGVAINDGRFFGEEAGLGFFRFNLATRRDRVRESLENIEKMVRSINQ